MRVSVGFDVSISSSSPPKIANSSSAVAGLVILFLAQKRENCSESGV
jgi:hypothetical protein